MPEQVMSGNEIRQSFIDFFKEREHTFVPSSSLVPGGDQTLLFTNAGMVQFKDVFLGTDTRPYNRAVNSQKCMRVAGKHNDLDDVGRDDAHHTFFEMLGNWSFGDYYKKEAIEWAWELLTEVWKLPKDVLYATCFEDEKGEIPRDDEAAGHWHNQPGMLPEHILYFGRKENFWEMADLGPCGPCSEIHIDLGPDACDLKDTPGHVCQVNGDCKRFLELWNLVFIQYNRLSPTDLEPLPQRHVDTGMGFDRIVSVLQHKRSNYRTDLFYPLIQAVQELTGDSDQERDSNFTPYRVIADHSRAAAFLIADGVIPGNTGRNYVCRMIIRRAARFGSKLGLNEPFLAKIAAEVITEYGDFYPELRQNEAIIREHLTREEERFQRTVESGVARLDQLLGRLQVAGEVVLPGDQAFDLYATYGLPLEITRDIARERNLDVDEAGFLAAMEDHRLASGGGAFGEMEADDLDVYRSLGETLQAAGTLNPEGVTYDPYTLLEVEGPVLAIVKDGRLVDSAEPGDPVEVLLAETGFYLEAGGQVSDTGTIVSAAEPRWEIQIEGLRRPAAGILVHAGKVVRGQPRTGDTAIAAVDVQRRKDIMRNHTATHLLHAALHAVLGSHARQAGSLVAPDRLRFDFTHQDALTPQELDQIERYVNEHILNNYPLDITYKPLQQAKSEGAMALFGEKYADVVRTIRIGEPEPFSYELCGGTHVSETGDIGLFIITSEGSTAAGIRRIEAITGRAAYEHVHKRLQILNHSAQLLNTTPDEVVDRINSLQEEASDLKKQISSMRQSLVSMEFTQLLDEPVLVEDVRTLAVRLPDADSDTLRQMADRFRQRYPSQAVAVLASVQNERPILVAAVTEDLVQRGINAGQLIKYVAAPLGGGGGGKPTLAQAGGKDAAGLEKALASVPRWIEENLS
ncbi:MAG: alanine--tRNA ligase [Anaerolineales bacterium]